MTATTPLIVPVEVDAWVLNDQAAHGDPRTAHSVRASMNFANLQAQGDPGPAPFWADDTNFVNEAANHGTYVMWTLPAAMRRATQDPASGEHVFPEVPNRWLVVRHSWALTGAAGAAPLQAAWIVQSDALGESDGVPYLDPTQRTATQTLLGHKVPISAAAPWQEPAGKSPVVLQAIADGNPSFAAYQPFNQNVFSIHDDMLDPATGQAIDDSTVSYGVVGWYSDPASDVLAGWDAATPGAFDAALAALGWTASTAQTGTRTSICQGQAPGVLWQPDGPVTPPAPATAPQIAVGNTSIDAIVAYAQAALVADPVQGVDAATAGELLEAFQYDLLPLLGAAGTEQLLQDRLRQNWFSTASGGTSWAIVAAPSPGDEAPVAPLTAAELALETALLAALTAAQATVDTTTRALVGARRRLLELWWKAQTAGYFGHGGLPWGITSQAQLDAAVAAQAGVVQGLVQTRAAAQANLPTPAPGEPLGPVIAAFAAKAGLPATRVLKAVPAAPFAEPLDPVMVVSGTGAGAMVLTPAATIACRWSTELLAAITVTPGGGAAAYAVSADALVAALPASAWANLPAVVPALVAELFLLDPVTATAGAALAGESLTAAQLETAAASIATPVPVTGLAPALAAPWPWVQPWKPLYLDWSVEWYPIPFRQPGGGGANWAFDGVDYATTATATVAATGATPLIARCLLTPKPGFEFRARLEQFIADNPSSPATANLAALDQVLETVDGWDFLSQAFSGLSTELALWDPIAMQNPPSAPLALPGGQDSLAGLLAEAVRHPPQSSLPGTSGGRHHDPPTTSSFEGMRGGQFVFDRLCVVDAFGQALDVVTQQSSASSHPLRGGGTTPGHPVASQDAARIVELAPRILQPARLDLDFVPQAASGSPILGWVLPNHLDGGLAIYGESGAAYGELMPVTDLAGQAVVAWLPAEASPYPDLPTLAAAEVDLGGFLTALAAAGQASFAAFITSIDETLWTVDPLGARTDAFLSVMLGRPLALVAGTLGFELESDAARDPSWPFTFSDPPLEPLFVGYEFPVRLGDLGYRQDGLLGYFVDGAYTSFNAVHVPTADPYLAPVGPGNYVDVQFAATGAGPRRRLTMLVDPRASVHAACGLLPSISTALDPAVVDASLRTMNAAFRTGPTLVQQRPDPAGTPGLVIPAPAERHGTWSWSELSPTGGWATLPIAPANASGGLPPLPPTLREGFLNLTGGLDE